ncbi:MAG TPA: hypothetical protein VFP36_00945 [Usitatibacter sp.]|nr:hypothetical protein [Usitatibacter sp.]
MKKLAPLFAAIALVSSGAVMAETGDDNQSPSPGESQSAPDAKKPGGFVLLQRNIYVPVDAEGKLASSQMVVIEKQGFVTTEEFEAEARDAKKDTGATKDDEATKEGEAKPEEPAASPPARTSRSKAGGHSLGEGPTVKS